MARPVIARICARTDLEEGLSDYLERHGFDLRLAHEGWSAEALLAGGDVALAVADLDFPDIGGIEMMRRFGGGADPIFVLVGRTTELVDRVLALESGAAEVLSRPIVLRELATRIAGLLARRGSHRADLVILENATVDMRAALVMHRSGGEEQLSPGQVSLLRFFASNPRRVLARDDIIAAAPAESFDAFDRSIDSRIVRLRRKLDTEAIVTVRGAGYRFDPPTGS